jgi:uncharacterized iron-regulated membrane protein
MGLLFGVANQVVLALLAAGVLCLVGWGYRMWWLRLPRRGTGRPTRGGMAGPPVGGQRANTGAVLVGTLAAAALGIFLPVLGVSLLAFLVVDAVRLAVAARPRRAARS